MSTKTTLWKYERERWEIILMESLYVNNYNTLFTFLLADISPNSLLQLVSKGSLF